MESKDADGISTAASMDISTSYKVEKTKSYDEKEYLTLISNHDERTPVSRINGAHDMVIGLFGVDSKQYNRVDTNGLSYSANYLISGSRLIEVRHDNYTGLPFDYRWWHLNGNKGYFDKPHPRDKAASKLKNRRLFSHEEQFDTYLFIVKNYEYVEKYAVPAGIPPSVALAQGILESGSGKSMLARKGNNLFGIKGKRSCKSCINLHDDDPNDMFRTWSTTEGSWKFYSKLLSSCNKSYAIQRNGKSAIRAYYCYDWAIDRYPISWDYIYDEYSYSVKSGSQVPKDIYLWGKKMVPGKGYHLKYYEWWGLALSASGYATSKHYPDKISNIIERFGLDYLDYNGFDEWIKYRLEVMPSPVREKLRKVSV